MPVYNGSSMFEAALTRVVQQTHENIHVLVSIDGGQSRSEVQTTVAIVNKVRSKSRFKIDLFIQRRNLGFTDNYNFLLKRATGDFYGFMQHDDVVETTYYERLVACMHDNPQAVSCHPPMVYRLAEGQHRPGVLPHGSVLHSESIRGPVTMRLTRTLGENLNITSHKGIVRRLPDPLGFRPFLMPYLHKQSNPDLLQMTRFAVYGEIVETNAHYQKWFSNDTEHSDIVLRLSDSDWDRATVERHVSYYDTAFAYHRRSQAVYEMSLKQLGTNSFFVRSRDVDKVRRKYSQLVRQKTNRVAVLGGGIMGCLMALLFKRYGHDVTIFDQAPDLLKRTSNQNEGKIHLGFEYSGDVSLRTGMRMLNASLVFSSYLEHLLEQKIDWVGLKSTPSHYAVPYTSLLSADELQLYFERLQANYEKMVSSRRVDRGPLLYLGQQLRLPLFRRLAHVPETLNRTFFGTVFETQEYAISLAVLNQLIRDKVREKGIRVICNSTVTQVTRVPKTPLLDRFSVETIRPVFSGGVFGAPSSGNEGSTAVFQTNFRTVVNCLWEGRMRIDRQLALPSHWSDGNNVRLKFGVHAQLRPNSPLAASNVPSLTIVNGPFGDFVKFNTQQKFYFTWYPITVAGMVVNQESLPTEWNEAAKGNWTAHREQQLLRDLEIQLNRIFPVSSERLAFECPKLVAGLIVAEGNLPIDTLSSGLHHRAAREIFHDRGYFSVSTQKFTAAPHIAMEFEDLFFKSGILSAFS